MSSSALDHDILKQDFQSAKVNKMNQIKARTRARWIFEQFFSTDKDRRGLSSADSALSDNVDDTDNEYGAMKSPHGADGNEQSLLGALMATEALASPNGDEGHDDTLVYEEVDEEADVDEELQGMAVAALRQKIHSAQNSPTRETPIGRHVYWCSKAMFIHFVRRCLVVAALRQTIHSAQNASTRETPIGRHIYWGSKVAFIHYIRRFLVVAALRKKLNLSQTHLLERYQQVGIYWCSISLFILISAQGAPGAPFTFPHPHDMMTGQICNPQVLQKIHRFYSL